MPFKSEAQRKYLWANEPEIARDWTDTYGSKIQAADGGRMGFRVGKGAGMEKTSDTGMPTTQSGALSSGANYGHSGTGDGQHVKTRTTFKTPKQEPKGDGIIQGIKNFYRDNIYDRRPHDLKARRNFLMKNNLMKLDPVLDQDEYGDPRYSDSDWLTSSEGLEHLHGLGYTGGKLNPADDRGEGGQTPWWLRQQGPVASTPATTQTASTLGSGHFQVPLAQVLNQQRAADGGMIGSVGGTSRQKYQEGEIVGAEMEGAEMEGAMMQSQEVIKELYDALIAQGLSPQEAIEKIKEIIASSQAEGPQSPMMGEEFPGQEFGRAPAAYGGIMDTYTGRRKYGLGSFIKKAVGKVKKLASSKLGKLALMYAAGTYLGGTQALSGQMGGAGTFAQRLKDPKLLANLVNSQGTWGTAGKTAPTLGKVDIGFQEALRKKALEQKNKSLLSKGLGWLQKNPTTAILGGSLGAGLMTDKMPIEELDDVQGEWDEDKEAFDRYLASLDTGDSYRVPVGLRAAQGGRIGRQEGGLMDLGGMEKDYRNDGGFVPIGGQEKADDVPARLSRNEFVFTADAVRNAGGGDIDKGAEVMENVMKNLEGGGQISEESQGQGAQEMFETSERLSEVI
jgi:hypothetical protein